MYDLLYSTFDPYVLDVQFLSHLGACWQNIHWYVYSIIFCCVCSCHAPSATAMYSSNIPTFLCFDQTALISFTAMCNTIIVLHMAVNKINAVWSKHKNVGIYQCLLSTVCSCNTPCVPCMPYSDVWSECTGIPIGASLICLSGAIARSACVGAHTKCSNTFLPFTDAVGWMPCMC